MTATPTFPPVVEAYLADLERALAGSDPRERAETLAAVREHAAESLALHGTDDAGTQRVLDELGPVDAIADASTPATPATPAAPATTLAADVWLVVLSVASLALFVVPLVAAAAVAWAIVRVRSGSGNRGLQKFALVVGAVSFVGAVALYASHVLAG